MSVVKIRKPEAPFEVIDRASLSAIRDPIALGIWAYLRSKPEGWVVREVDIREHFDLGRDRYRDAIRYLCEAEAAADIRIHDAGGRIVGRELMVNFSVSAEWIARNRAPENPAHGDRAPENPAHGDEIDGKTNESAVLHQQCNESHHEPGKTVRRKKPSDGKSACIYNRDPIQNTDSLESTEGKSPSNPPATILPKILSGTPDASPPRVPLLDCEEVLEHLNRRTGGSFKAKTDGKPSKSIELIRQRMREHGKDALIGVIDRKAAEWMGDAKMEAYLRPSTLFGREKCEGYVGELSRPVKPKSARASHEPCHRESAAERNARMYQEAADRVAAHDWTTP